MTKTIKYTCNKCDEEIKGGIFKVDITTVSSPPWIHHYHCDGIKLTQPNEYNLCVTCVKKIKEYLKYE